LPVEQLPCILPVAAARSGRVLLHIPREHLCARQQDCDPGGGGSGAPRIRRRDPGADAAMERSRPQRRGAREYRSESGARPVGQPPLTVERQGDVMRGSTITGMGRYVPRRVMTNHELEKIVETTDEWIVSRTGIRERRIAAPEEASSDLAFHAAQEALADAGVSPEQI